MRSGLYALFALAACYSPAIIGGVPCEPATPACPNGQTCQASGDGFVCARGGSGPDAGDDAPPSDGGTCLGQEMLGSLCLSSEPTGPVTLSSTTPINSANAAPGDCTEIRQVATGSLCIIAGTTITIPTGVTARVFAISPTGTAGGTNPVVLVATQSITILGTLDVASHVGEQIASMPVLGAGARSAVGCAAIGLDGTQGRDSGDGSFGGGGAAGGSLGSLGGAGGSGGNNNQVARGNPVLGNAPTTLAGGCPGGNGGNGDGTLGGGGIGGGGGGAVYLLAGQSITITGRINASGAGGGLGGPGEWSSGGGGGGGSGGMIGLEAPQITVTGTLIANGGGGAGGGGNEVADSGAPGSDPSSATMAAAGGIARNGGGGGGAGSVGAAAGSVGRNGSGQFPEAAGGGGGGGSGIIRVFGVPPSSLTGAISPPAT